MPVKVCLKCGGTYALNWFRKNARNRDGLDTWCKTCRRAERAAYRTRPEVRPLVNASNRRQYWRQKRKREQEQADHHKE